jgi:hypothetical protein
MLLQNASSAAYLGGRSYDYIGAPRVDRSPTSSTSYGFLDIETSLVDQLWAHEAASEWGAHLA